MTPVQFTDWLLEQCTPLEATTMATADAAGMTLAADAVAALDLPHWDNSAMDGYAIRARDAPAAGAVLRVVGEQPAGSTADPLLAPGEAVRIMTGAALPTQADTVVRVEDTVGDRADDVWADSAVTVTIVPALGANVRRRGEDAAAGARVARAGRVLTAARQAALIAAGVDEVSVRREPRVAVVATGSELRDAGAQLARGQIRDSNSHLIAGKVREAGIRDVQVHRSDDDAVSLRALLVMLGAECDAVITTGGIGPGTHDAVRLAVATEPGVRAVHLPMRPGQHQCAGRLVSGGNLFALPGNPVSAAVSFELFVLPALQRMRGRERVRRYRVRAVTEVTLAGAAGRLQVVPVRVVQHGDLLRCEPVVHPRRMSHAVGGHGDVDGYALLEAESVAAGGLVTVLLVES